MSDGLNNLTNKNTKQNKKTHVAKITGDRDDRKICVDAQSEDIWQLFAKPLSEEMIDVMDNYIDQLLSMPFGDIHNMEVDDESYEYIPIFKAQSGITADMNITPADSAPVFGNMMFRDQMAGYKTDIESATDPTRHLQDKNDVDLGDFFSRPQKVFEVEWGTGALAAATFNPWTEFFRNPRVRNRIANFKLMRCDLRMKVVVNGNGFQYGRALVGYWPMSGYDTLSSHSALVPEDMVQTSQLPHLFIDPTTSSGGEMKIPFFWHENYFDIPSASWDANTGRTDAGRVLMRTINELKHANGASDKVTISFFCWAENMQLSIPTSVNPVGLVPQSGQEVDEANTKGMISGPATTVAKFAGIAATYTPIAPYAMATSKVATGVANMAKMLGYSRPPNTSNPDPYRPTPISQLATTTTPDTAMKMTVDDKQELTIDPRISGIGPSDPFVIREIAKKESYLTTFNWEVGAAPETLLWNARVNPVLWAESTAGAAPAIHLPACAVAALPFRYWTGSMKFRFQIVASNFHKGRIEFRYDPNYAATGTFDEYNVNYIEVIDIAETQDFTMKVGNAQEFSLLEHLIPGVNSVTEGYSTTNYTNALTGRCNGVLQCRILNELTVPNSDINNDIQINVFVSMGDDFEVFVPDDAFQKYTFFEPQSGIEAGDGKGIVPDSQNTQEPSAPQQAESDNIGGDPTYSPDLNKVFAGESIVSFRPLLKRYNLWRREQNSIDGLSGHVRIFKQRSAFPFLRRGNGDSYIEGSATGGYNYANTVLLHWVTMCYAGFRGSIRYKWLYTKSGQCCYEGGGEDIGSRVYVERQDPPVFGPPPYGNDENVFGALTNPAQRSRDVLAGSGSGVPTGTRGTVFATDLINPNVEFEVPYQVQFRFVPGKPSNFTNFTNDALNNYAVTYEGYTTNTQTVDMHVAAGEDFQCYFWSGMPRIYYENTPPLAVE